MPVAYFNLATQLHNANMVEASVAWFERALAAAENSSLDEYVVGAFENALRDAQKHSDGSRQSSYHQLAGSPSQGHLTSQLSDHSREREVPLPPIHSSSPSSNSRPSVYNREERGHLLDDHFLSQPEPDPNGGGVEPGNDEYGDLAVPLGGAGRNYSQSQLNRASSVGTSNAGRHDGHIHLNSVEDLTSVVSGNSRQRPKSAVSKLGGGYDAPPTAGIEKIPKESSGSGGIVVPGRMHKKPPVGPQQPKVDAGKILCMTGPPGNIGKI